MNKQEVIAMLDAEFDGPRLEQRFVADAGNEDLQVVDEVL